MMFLGRQFNYPVALEGALKMKEISYIHASGHPGAELKHGVIALISPKCPACSSRRMIRVFDKNVSNIEEVQARAKARSSPSAPKAMPKSGKVSRRRYLYPALP